MWLCHRLASLNQSIFCLEVISSTISDIEVKQIPISKIKVVNRMRRTDDNNIEDLKRSIKEIGLLHPICVAKKDDGYVCLSGLHRMSAMQQMGEEYISATVRVDDDLINQLVEIEENLVAKRNNAIEEAEAIILREQILTKLGRKAVVGSNQYSGDDLITNSELAKQLNLSRRTYSYKKSVANINQEAKDLLCETKHANNMMDMYRLQKLPDHLQIEIANVLASGKAKTFKRAWVLAHLKFADNKWDEDIQTTKDKLGVPKSIQRWDRKKDKLNDICYYVSHNEDAIVKKRDGLFGTNQLNNYAMLPEQSRWFVNYFSKVGEIVCDPYAGKGTNIIAAAYEGRRVIGYDLNLKNTELIKETCLNNTNIDPQDLTLHHSCGVEMVEYADAKNIIDLFLLDPPYYNQEDYGTNDERDLCYSKDIETFNDRFKQSLINMKRLIKPSNYKKKVFKPIIIKCGQIRRGDKGIIDMADEIITMSKDLSLVLHDKIYNELRSATQHYNVGRCIKNRYTIKSHETSLVFLKYEN